MSDTKLTSYADRIDRLEGERKDLAADVRDVFTEVKHAGYNPKALRKVLAERRKKTDAEFEAELETYRAALGISTYRAVAEQLGVSKSKLQRLVPRADRGTATTPHDSETGEIGGQTLKGAAGGPSEPNEPAERSVNVALPSERVALGIWDDEGSEAGTIKESCGDTEDAERSAPYPKRHVANGLAPNVMPVSPGPQDTPSPDRALSADAEIDLTIPPFLDRRPDSAKRPNVTETA